jgi:hypothetical protein
MKNQSQCPVPNCPVKDEGPYATKPDPKCMCHKPIMICLKPGQHCHPCPVHPDYVIVGRNNATL